MFGVVLGRHRPPTTTAELMSLQALPDKPAPDFVLTDQHGVVRSLDSFRGKAVALYFMDPRCTDVCPIVAREFVEADRLLGPLAQRVAFVGIDVNPNVRTTAALRHFDDEHGLQHLENWYYFTGSLSALHRVWGDYGIQVAVATSGAVIHTTIVDFIGPGGHERRLVAPRAEVRANGTGYLPFGQLSEWAHGIAAQLRRLVRS